MTQAWHNRANVLRILHTNDLHSSLNEAKLQRLAELRADVHLYFDSGDSIKTGNLGIPRREEPIWREFARLNCTASCLGNRETHVIEAAFKAKVAGAQHPILCANLRKKDGTRPLPTHLVVETEGVKVGVVGVMVPMVTERMVTQAASAYLWDPPDWVAIEVARELRPQVDLLIALTHIGHRQDLELAEMNAGYDIILGGHSHTMVPTPVKVGKTWVCQGGSHGRFAGVYEWTGELSGSLVPLI